MQDNTTGGSFQGTTATKKPTGPTPTPGLSIRKGMTSIAPSKGFHHKKGRHKIPTLLMLDKHIS